MTLPLFSVRIDLTICGFGNENQLESVWKRVFTIFNFNNLSIFPLTSQFRFWLTAVIHNDRSICQNGLGTAIRCVCHKWQ